MTKGTKDDGRSDTDAPNAAMLRDDIDSGETGDKIGFPDPSAAPLGTDAEAGGNAATREEMKTAREAETSRPDERQPSDARPNSATDD
jgi:hypothetical protein